MSSTRKVNVKWGKQKFELEIDLEQPVGVFKLQLYSLSMVNPDKQKIMFKGKIIDEQLNLASLDLKDGTTLMMMGTPDENAIIVPTTPQTIFAEDLTPDQQLAAQSLLPAGLDNIGNTCYLNASIQCLRAVPQISEALKRYQPAMMSRDPHASLTLALKDLLGNLDSLGPATDPTFFNTIFRVVHPQFMEEDRGFHKQQDAEEAFSSLMTSLANQLTNPNASTTPPENLIDHLFGIRFQSTLKCLESAEEEPTMVLDSARKLSCHITIDINFLLDGLKLALQEQISKNSPSLQRDANYAKRTVVTRLPPWLTIQFMRFYYKTQQRERAKILRAVQFPRVLDLIDLCSEDTQRSLRQRRARYVEMRDAKKSKTDDVTPEQATPAAEPDLPDPGFTAQYELKAVLTHIGRTLDGGHYMAWIHRQGDEWLKFDDKQVTKCTYQDDIVKLVGGGDWHTAYLCLYQERTDFE